MEYHVSQNMLAFLFEAGLHVFIRSGTPLLIIENQRNKKPNRHIFGCNLLSI